MQILNREQSLIMNSFHCLNDPFLNSMLALFPRQYLISNVPFRDDEKEPSPNDTAVSLVRLAILSPFTHLKELLPTVIVLRLLQFMISKTPLSLSQKQSSPISIVFSAANPFSFKSFTFFKLSFPIIMEDSIGKSTHEMQQKSHSFQYK